MVSADDLAAQDSRTSSKIIRFFGSNPAFASLSATSTRDILQRDAEDAEKLQKGIMLAVDKGVIPSDVRVEPVCKVQVTGKTAEQVADEIIQGLGGAQDKGCVMTLQGLSGTGKGTTVAMLKKKLPNATTWSNGNVFRSLTLLAATYAEKKRCSLEEAITPQQLELYCTMLEFGKFRGKFDVRIRGLGYDMYVSDVCNTTLKSPKVSRNIPTVAQVTQGEVINFVQSALRTMADDGVNVLLEGREQTLNYIRTPYRFELVLDDTNVIGQRRAAQRIGAEALKLTTPESSSAEVEEALRKALSTMVEE